METEIHYLFWSRWSNSSEFVPDPSAEKTSGSDVKGDAFWLLSSTTNVLENK